MSEALIWIEWAGIIFMLLSAAMAIRPRLVRELEKAWK
jgi:hypothetical protein